MLQAPCMTLLLLIKMLHSIYNALLKSYNALLDTKPE